MPALRTYQLCCLHHTNLDKLALGEPGTSAVSPKSQQQVQVKRTLRLHNDLTDHSRLQF